MEKPLSEYSLEELWQLFPIELKEHNANYVDQYNNEVLKLSNILKEDIVRVNHIGSTAVKNLYAKPIVDILLEVKDTVDTENLILLLTNRGWLLMSEEVQPLKLSFNKGYTPEGFADEIFHLHIRHKGNWGELYFRDYLVKYPKVAQEYEQLKFSLLEKYKYDRDAYTQAKTEFIEQYTNVALKEFHNKYKES